MFKKFILFLSIIFFTTTKSNAKLFSFDIDINGRNEKLEYNSITSFKDDIDAKVFDNLTTKYSDINLLNFNNGSVILTVKGVEIKADLLNSGGGLKAVITDPTGLLGNVTYTGAGANMEELLRSIVNQIQTDLTNKFDDDSINLAEIFSKITKLAIETTPTDPIAGNPLSLMNQMLDMDYSLATNNKNINSIFLPQFYTSSNNSNRNNSEVKVAILPFNFFFKWTKNGSGLRIDIPISYSDIDGSIAFNLQLGLAFRIMLTDTWSLTPSIRTGIDASIDAASGAILYSGAITSKKDFILNKKLTLELVDTIFIIKSLSRDAIVDIINKFDDQSDIQKYIPDYNISNYATKNGLAVKYQFSSRFGVRTGFTNNYYFGDTKLYISNYNDINLDLLIFSKKKQVERFILRGKYGFGEKDYQSFNVSFGCTF